jgi:hypothetical protein
MAEEHSTPPALWSTSLPEGCSTCNGEPFIQGVGGWVRCNCPRGEALTAADRMRDSEEDRGLQSPSQWLRQVDDWPAGLLAYKTQINLQLLNADALYHRAKASKRHRWPGDAGYEALLAAFDGVAGVLFEANALTHDILEHKLPSLIFNMGENGPWAERGIGGSSIGFREAYKRSFRGPISKWMAKLQESEMKQTAEREVNGLARPFVVPGSVVSGDERKALLEAYKTECKACSVHVTYEDIANGANKRWKSRTQIDKWLQHDPRYDGQTDRLIREHLTRETNRLKESRLNKPPA